MDIDKFFGLHVPKVPVIMGWGYLAGCALWAAIQSPSVGPRWAGLLCVLWAGTSAAILVRRPNLSVTITGVSVMAMFTLAANFLVSLYLPWR